MKNLTQSLFLLTCLFLVSGFSSLEALFAPKAELWSRWSKHDAKSTKVLDHGVWSTFLKSYVKKTGGDLNTIAYKSVSKSDHQKLQGYISYLSKQAVSQLSKREQFAYWVNLYNAKTVEIVVAHYPVKSIRDIDLEGGFFSSGPWKTQVLQIEGEKVSLNDIEHRILRPIWKDPRIHYAVNCASVGCPNLQAKAFTSANTNILLEKAARDYVNSPRGVNVTSDGLILSKIYSWFAVDFGGTEETVLAHIAKYADAKLKAQLKQSSGVSDFAYDWGLNEPKS